MYVRVPLPSLCEITHTHAHTHVNSRDRETEEVNTVLVTNWEKNNQQEMIRIHFMYAALAAMLVCIGSVHNAVHALKPAPDPEEDSDGVNDGSIVNIG